jgi:hypothetical protein
MLFPEGAIMRPLSLVLPASLLLLASSAGAQTGNYPLTDNGQISTVKVPRQAPAFQILGYQADAVSGAYAMSNGWRLNVEPSTNGVVARIDRELPMRLIALSPDKFVSRDGNVSMEFNRGENADEMLMSYVPNTSVAQVIVVKATLAQR